jgi:hypothetical protein
MLYGAAWKAAKVLGFKRIVTYTLPEEGGASLRAAGWKPTFNTGGKQWNCNARKRAGNPHSDNKPKIRREATTGLPAVPPPQVHG